MTTLNIPINVSYLMAVLPYLCIIALAWVVYRQHKRVFVLEAFNKGLVAHAKAAQIPRDPLAQARLIEGWKKQYEELPENTPKWTAYRNRLIEIGELDKDGNKKAPPLAAVSDGD